MVQISKEKFEVLKRANKDAIITYVILLFILIGLVMCAIGWSIGWAIEHYDNKKYIPASIHFDNLNFIDSNQAILIQNLTIEWKK